MRKNALIRVTRGVAIAAALLALAAVSPGAAYAQPSPGAPSTTAPARFGNLELPEGWQIIGTGTGRQLVWTASEPVRMGDARVEFHAGDRLLGRPVAQRDGRSFRLPLGDARVGSALVEGVQLRVTAGGRRLDEGGPARSARVRPLAPVAVPEAPLPANPVDPGKLGRYRTVSGEYDLTSVRLPGFPEPVEMRATVVGPADAPGKRPVALFLHGRHGTCYTRAASRRPVTGPAPRAPCRYRATRGTCGRSGCSPPRAT